MFLSIGQGKRLLLTLSIKTNIDPKFRPLFNVSISYVIIRKKIAD